MVNERGLDIHHSTVFRWVQEYSPEIDKRFRPHLRLTNDSWRVDETYILVKGKQKYLYRAVDSVGNTLDFLLTAKRDTKAAKRFLRKTLKAVHTSTPGVITKGKNPAYPKAVKELKAAKKLPEIVKLRQIKYLNNIIEQDHPWSKRLVKPGMGFGSFNTARRTIKGYEMREHDAERTSYWRFQRRCQRASSLPQSNQRGGCIIGTFKIGVFCPYKVLATQPFKVLPDNLT